jgi:hypothetical protein
MEIIYNNNNYYDHQKKYQAFLYEYNHLCGHIYNKFPFFIPLVLL